MRLIGSHLYQNKPPNHVLDEDKWWIQTGVLLTWMEARTCWGEELSCKAEGRGHGYGKSRLPWVLSLWAIFQYKPLKRQIPINYSKWGEGGVLGVWRGHESEVIWTRLHFVYTRDRKADGKPDKGERNGARWEVALCVVPVFSVNWSFCNSSVPPESHTGRRLHRDTQIWAHTWTITVAAAA